MEPKADSVSVSEVRALLESRRKQWHEIADGASVSPSWIYKFIGGRIGNPGHRTLSDLRDFILFGKRAERKKSPTPA